MRFIPHLASRRLGPRICALAAALCLSWAAGAAAGPDSPREDVVLQDLFDGMDRYFDRNPDLKNTPGSGWKPFNRMKHLHLLRMESGVLPEPDARWRAWRQKRRMEAVLEPGRQASWFSLGPANFGGRMLAIDFDATNPGTVYAGAAGGGVWKSTDSGTSWAAVADDIPSMAVGGIGVSRTSPNVVVIGTGEATLNTDRIHGVGILRSTDAGATWVTTDLSQNQSLGHGFHVVTAGPSGVFLAGSVDGLYRSSDDGATWTQVMPTAGTSFVNGWTDVQWDPQDSTRVYAVKGNDSSGNGVYVSADDGVTWAMAGAGQPASVSIGKSKLGVSANTVYCYVGNPGFGGGVFDLIKSTNDGVTWAQTNATALPTGQSWYNLSCVADPNRDTRVICGAVTFARSNDGGLTFSSIGSSVHVDHHVLMYEPGSTSRVWALTDGGVYFSPTDGSFISWVAKNTGLVTYQFYDVCLNHGPDPYYVLGGTQDNGTDKWSGTTTWADGLGADGMVCNIDRQNGTTVYAETQFGDQWKSVNSGVGFSPINTGITGTGRWVTPVALDPADGDVLYTETADGLFKTTDGGAQWNAVSTSRAVWISVSPLDSDVVWTVNGTTVRRSTDAGLTWPATGAFGFSVGNATKILAHPNDVNGALCTFSTYSAVSRVAVTTDAGATWSDVTGNLPQMPVHAIAVNPLSPADWFLGTELGVWHSSDGGASWLPFESGMPNVVVCDLEIEAGLQKLVAGTHGRGAWEIGVSSVVDAELTAPAAPRHLMLDPPWPNPVRDRTLLRYAARSEAPVRLRIYDVQGRLVSDLETFARGDGIIRSSPWFPDGVRAGVYLAVLEAGAERVTRKITVLR